jgi:hypothetical protein
MEDVRKEFLVDRDETGREVVFYPETGKKYYVEYIGDGRMADWGSYNPSTGKVENKKGAGKHSGSVKEEESILTKENGFDDTVVGKGSPYYTIHQMHEEYKRSQGL